MVEAQQNKITITALLNPGELRIYGELDCGYFALGLSSTNFFVYSSNRSFFSEGA